MESIDFKPQPQRNTKGLFALISVVLLVLKYFWENMFEFYPSDFADPEHWIFMLMDFAGFYAALSLVYFIIKRFNWRYPVKILISIVFGLPLGFLFLLLLLTLYLTLSNLSAI